MGLQLTEKTRFRFIQTRSSCRMSWRKAKVTKLGRFQHLKRGWTWKKQSTVKLKNSSLHFCVELLMIRNITFFLNWNPVEIKICIICSLNTKRLSSSFCNESSRTHIIGLIVAGIVPLNGLSCLVGKILMTRGCWILLSSPCW